MHSRPPEMILRAPETVLPLSNGMRNVFHLMKTLERALHALAAKFGVPFEHETWHKVIEQIEKKVRGMDSSFWP